MRFLDAARAGFKASAGAGASKFQFPGANSHWSLYGPRTAIDFNSEAGSPMDNSIVAPCIRWKSTNWTQARPVVRRTKRGSEEPANEFEHPLIQLIENPNPFYNGRLLREGLLQDFELDGTAFMQVIYGRFDLPVALYWMPTDMMRPVYQADGSEWVRYWEYSVGGRQVKLAPDEVIVWQQGIDRATAGRRGYSPFKAAIAEMYSDNEARNTVNTILRNRLQMGVMASPSERYFAELVKAGVDTKQAGYNQAQAAELEAKIVNKNTRDGRGSFNMFSVPVSITEFGSVLDKLDSQVLRGLAEERVCAAFGVHPVVVMLGTGLRASSDKHNMEMAQRMSWDNGIVPEQDSFADLISTELLPLMDSRPDTARFDFDRSRVEALRENADQLSTRLMSQWKDDGITHDMLMSGLGYKVDEARKGKYYSELVGAGDPAAEDPEGEAGKAFKAAVSAKWRERRAMYDSLAD